MYEWSATPYANGLMAPWVAQSAPVTQQLVQEQVAPAMGMERGEGNFGGYSVPGDPSTATQTSQATKDRVRDSLTGSLGRAVGKSALSAGTALAAGMPAGMIGQGLMSGLFSPGTVGNVLGGAVNATLGTQPEGWMGKTVAAIPGIAGSFLGGPVGGLIGGLIGGPVASAIADGLGTRSREDLRDDYEGDGIKNQIRGRQAYADRVGIEQAAAKVRDALPNSAAAMHAMEQAIAKTRDIEKSYGITPSYGLDPGKSSLSYGGWGNVGGPSGGARAVDRGYGPSMGGFAGLGIGNPSSYGGGGNSSGGGPGRGGRGDSTGTGGGYSDGRGGVSGL